MPIVSGLQQTFSTELDVDEATASERVGAIRFVDDRVFKYSYFEEALSVGNTAELGAHEIADSDVVSWDSTTQTITVTTNDFQNLTLDGAYIFLNTGTGPSQWAKVSSNGDSTAKLENPLSLTQTGDNVFHPDGTAPDATTDYHVYSTVAVTKADAGVATRVSGVDQSGHTANQYGWLQISGPALVLIDDSDSPLIAGSGLVNSASTAGHAEGVATGTAAEIPLVFGYSLIAEADARSADDVVPCVLQCL